MMDSDISEMFLNFMLDEDIRPYAGVDLSNIFKEERNKEARERAESARSPSTVCTPYSTWRFWRKWREQSGVAKSFNLALLWSV